jgi:DNA-binding Lrp family transcriptional regulator
MRELGRDGRLSNVELARRVRMSESACLRRVRALEHEEISINAARRMARRSSESSATTIESFHAPRSPENTI